MASIRRGAAPGLSCKHRTRCRPMERAQKQRRPRPRASGRAAGAATLSQVPPRSAPPSCCRLQTHGALPSPHKIRPGPRITGPERTTRLAPAARPRLPLPSRPAASMLRVAPWASLRPPGAWNEAPSFLTQPGAPTAFACPLSRRSGPCPMSGAGLWASRRNSTTAQRADRVTDAPVSITGAGGGPTERATPRPRPQGADLGQGEPGQHCERGGPRPPPACP